MIVGAVGASAATHTLVTEPDQGLSPIYDLISQAKRTIDATMYELADPIAEQLLGEAAENGLSVRVILDQNLERSNNQPAYHYLQQHGVQVVWASKKYAATHQKSIVVDGAMAAIMTLNLTSRYYSTTRDFAVLDTDPNDVAAIEQVFDADFSGAATGTPAADGLVWSPKQSNAALENLIRSARSSLLIENEEMSDSGIVSAIESAARSGVQVEVVMTYDSSYASNFAKLTAAGAQISTYSSDATPYIHAKAIVADYGTPTASGFVGSENFSEASLEKNRELGLALTDAAILTSIHGTLTEDFRGGTIWH
jgi:phosphatidylserine/phosphatidylglycerophosphate/cardiolipin synthase-like enzyme